MASTDEIIKAARELGKLIGTHTAAQKFESVVKRLQNDTDAQRALNDYNRHVQKLAQKEAQGQPIEVEEKRQLEKLQGAVVRNRLLGELQMVQMDYLDLMRKVDEAMSEASLGDVAPPQVAPGVSPGVAPAAAGTKQARPS